MRTFYIELDLKLYLNHHIFSLCIHPQISSNTHWAYFDYYYLRNLAENCLDLHWGAFGFPERSAADSTFWIGSSGANTPCHIDTYGVNLVAQVGEAVLAVTLSLLNLDIKALCISLCEACQSFL